MIHHMDARAHMRWFRDHDPLNHLRYSELVYRSLLSFDGAPNRLGATDFAQHARARRGIQLKSFPAASRLMII
jgi:hypothetical protein